MARATFRTIVPKLLPTQIFQDAFAKAARDMEKDVKGAFEDATETWKHKPGWRGYVRVGGTNIFISVGTTDEIFKFVDEGTVAHIIRPKRAGGVLHWVDAGGEDAFATEVHHPGFKGKKITDGIMDIWGGADGLMYEYFDDALIQAVMQSGHAI